MCAVIDPAGHGSFIPRKSASSVRHESLNGAKVPLQVTFFAIDAG
jgi:hypothetical protein